jgi:hypothetical protein
VVVGPRLTWTPTVCPSLQEEPGDEDYNKMQHKDEVEKDSNVLRGKSPGRLHVSGDWGSNGGSLVATPDCETAVWGSNPAIPPAYSGWAASLRMG